MKVPAAMTRFEFLGGMLAAAVAPRALAASFASDIRIERLKLYEIVITDNASSVEQDAARVLREHVGKLTGRSLLSAKRVRAAMHLLSSWAVQLPQRAQRLRDWTRMTTPCAGR